MKKLMSINLTILIAVSLILLAVSLCIKDVIINSINSEIVAKEVSSKIASTLKEYDIPYEQLEKIEKEIINSDETHEITSKYVNGLVDNVINDNNKVPNIEQELNALIKESEKYIKTDDYGITDETKEEIVRMLSSEDKFNRIYKTVSNDVKDKLSLKEKGYIEIYSRFISIEFRLILISIMLISIILIGLIKKSYYKWIINLSISFVISAIFILTVLPLFVDFALNDIIGNIGNYKINLSYLLNIGYIYLGIFSFLILLFLIVDKIKAKKDEAYEY